MTLKCITAASQASHSVIRFITFTSTLR